MSAARVVAEIPLTIPAGPDPFESLTDRAVFCQGQTRSYCAGIRGVRHPIPVSDLEDD